MKFDAQRARAWIHRNARTGALALGGFVLGLIAVSGLLAVLPDHENSASGLNNIESASGQASPAPAAAPEAKDKDADKAPDQGGDGKDANKKEGALKKLFGKDKDVPKTPAPSVRVAAVQQKNVAPELTAVGNVIANQSVAIIARVSSQITDVKFNAGDDVKAGQVLFVLDDREIKAALDQAKAKLAGDEAQLVALKKELDRQTLGVNKGFSSKSGQDVAQAQYASGQALVESDQAAVDSLEAQESYTTITAPIDGRTGTINFTLGNIVRANDTLPLVTINQIKPIAVQAALPQNSIDAVRNARNGGEAAASAVTNAGKQVQGKLQYIDNAIDTATGTYAVRAIFDNLDETLYPGTLVNLTIALGQDKPQLTVPDVAIQHDQKGGDYVYVIDTQNVAHMTPVKVIRIQDGHALIGDGLQGSDKVATDGMMTIKDNGPVTINATPEGITPSDEEVNQGDPPGASGLAPATSSDTDGAPDQKASGQSGDSSHDTNDGTNAGAPDQKASDQKAPGQ